MNVNINLNCPHCSEGQMKQVVISHISNEFNIGTVHKCQLINDRGCGKSFVISTRTQLEYKVSIVSEVE